MGLCLGVKATRNLIDNIGKGYDLMVKKWRNDITSCNLHQGGLLDDLSSLGSEGPSDHEQLSSGDESDHPSDDDGHAEAMEGDSDSLPGDGDVTSDPGDTTDDEPDQDALPVPAAAVVVEPDNARIVQPPDIGLENHAVVNTLSDCKFIPVCHII